MRKIGLYLRSMKFGMLLLTLILACSFVGSFVPQGREASYYLTEYPALGRALLAVSADDLFHAPYFLALLALLCLNLLLCSILRLNATIRARRAAPDRAHSAAPRPLTPAQRDALRALLTSRGFRLRGSVYGKNRLGHFGSFLTHLALLLILTFAALSMTLSTTADYYVYPDQPQTLPDGTVLSVQDFRATDDAGQIDYVSTLVVRDPSGEETAPAQVRVNQPLSFKGRVYYQQSYGQAGHVVVQNAGQASDAYLTETCFLSADGTNGLAYQGFYPDYEQDASGQVSLEYDPNAPIVHPIYKVSLRENGRDTPGVVLPGETVRVAGVDYTFEAPVAYPGIRVKTNPPLVLPALYGAFALMILGLTLCFFAVPVYAVVSDDALRLYAVKPVPELQKAIDRVLITKEEASC